MHVMIQKSFTGNIVDILALLIICAWMPLQDPTLVKLIGLPILLFFALRQLPPQYSRTASISLLFVWGLLEAVHPYNREIIMIWLFHGIAVWLGLRNSDRKLERIAIGTAVVAFLICILQISGVPQTNLASSWDNTYFSLLFGSNSAMCLLFCLLCQPLRNSHWKLRLSYVLICIPPIYLSNSIVGILIFSLGASYLLSPKKHLKLRRLIILVPVIAACALIAQPKEKYTQSFEQQVLLWKNNFQQWSILGKGPAKAQKLNAKEVHIESIIEFVPRIELHPQNDLLFHYHALGVAGLALRIIMYLLVLNLVLTSASYFPLILFLIQIQFTADSLALPTGVLFFFLLGQTLGSRHKIETKVLSPYYWPLLHTVWCTFLVIQLVLSSRYHLNLLRQTEEFLPKKTLKFSNPALQISHIIHLYKLKKFDECLKSIQKHLEIDPFHLYSHLLGADILIQQSKFQEALEWLKNSRMQLPSSDALKQKESHVLTQLSNN